MSAQPIVLCSGIAFSVFSYWNLAGMPGPGIYMLCRRDPNDLRTILYIGQTSSLATRLGPGHEHWAAALSLGMNEVLVHLLATTETDRMAVETRLRYLHPTPLNRQPAGFGLLSPLSSQGLMSANPLAEALARPEPRQPRGLLACRSPFEAG